MKRIKTTIGTLFMVAGAAFAGEWQRNTFPSTKHVEAGFAPGAGWSHTEAVQDISVSPLDPKFRAMLDNMHTAVYTEDGLNYKPLRMPHIGTPGAAAESVDFSPHDPNTMYLRVAHDYWTNMDPAKSPAGLWRSTDRGQTWQHLWQPPAGGYEVQDANNAGRSHMLEDPTVGRENHIYFGTTSEGLKRSIDDGATWQDVIPALNKHRIKTVMAVPAADNETFLYTIVEKKMPRHVAGEVVPLEPNYQLSNFSIKDACWKFNNNLNDASGNGYNLSGSVASWTDSTMEGTHAAKFNGSSPLASTNLIYAATQQRLTVSAWVQTTSTANQSIISYDRNQYWELGTRAGHVIWTVRDSGGAVNELQGSRIDDGDWHQVAAVFNNRAMQLYVDGVQVAVRDAGTTRLGSGNTVSGVIGAGFTGALDDVRIYNTRAFGVEDAKQLYLEDEHKNPIAQGQLWRIRVDAAGAIAEAVRLHAPLADFHDVEVNPHDPSKGWVIRKAIPFGFPYGGRELYQFSNFGDTLTPSTAVLGASATFDVVMINPSDSQHVLLACGTSKSSGVRWSRDGGTTWNGLNRKVGNYIPSIDSWMPHDYATFATGIEAAGKFIHRGSPFSFVPGEPNKLLWIDAIMGGLLESEDYGATWRTYATGGPNKGTQHFTVAQSDPNRWAVALSEHGFSVTTNNGLSWYSAYHGHNALLETLGNQGDAEGSLNWSAAHTGGSVAFHPTQPNIMLATWSMKGYILRSTDSGATWTDTGSYYPTPQWADLYWSPQDPNRVYAGILRSDDAGLTWNKDIGKTVIAVCDSDSNLIVGIDGMQSDVTAASLNMYVSTNGGDAWTSLPDPPRETVPGTSEQWLVTTTRRQHTKIADALVAIDPGSESLRILLAGRSGIYEYTAGSNSWTLRKTGLKNNRHTGPAEQVPWMGFVAFDPRPGYSHFVYAASQNDQFTQDAWALPQNPNRAYPGGENSDPYYRSTDGGITWEHLHGVNYPDAPSGGHVERIMVDSLGRMFAATTEGVYVFTNRTPSFTSGLVFNFTNGSYPNGRLDSNFGWNGGGAGWAVTKPMGLVVSDTAADLKLRHTTALNATGMTVGAVLRFSESGAAPSTDWRTLLEIGLTGSEDLGLKLVRRRGTASEYQLVFTKGADAVGGGGFNSGRVDGSRLGLNLAGGDADSDRLYLTYTITRGALPGDTWKATTRLYNLDTDPGMSNAIISQNNLAVNPADVLWGQGLYPYMNSSHNNASGNITGLRIESFTANPEPALSSAPIVRADAIEGSAYLESLVGSATDPDPADTLSYAKLSGPAWLSMATNGTLSGTPGNGDVGLNSWTVEVSDGRGETDSATLEINVAGQPLGPYAQWASDHGVGAMDEDFDKDGLDNLTEYALGGNPTNASDVGLLPTHVKTDDGWHYIYRRHLDPAAAGLVYTVETATNLASGDWTDTGTVEIDTDVIDSEFESVINAVDTTDKPALFIRLKIEAE